MEKNSKKFKGKKRLKFRHIYALIMLGVTVGLILHVVNLLVLTPRRDTGVPSHGHRMDEIDDLEESWKTTTEAFGATVDHVDYVSIFWNNGPVVYVSVRVEEGTSLQDAHDVAAEIIEHFIEVSNDVVLQYDIQVVVSYGDITEQRTENHAAVIQHVHEYNHELVEEILSWAERYRSEFNVERAERNINDFADSIKVVVGEEGLEAMLARVDAIDTISEAGYEDDDDHEPIPRFAVTVQIPSSDIANFPNWGTWNHEEARIDWNP